MLLAYASACFAWHDAHCASGSLSSCGTEVIEAWQSTHRSFACTEAEKAAALMTWIAGLASVSASFGAWPGGTASWQSMQSSFGTALGAAPEAAPSRNAATAKAMQSDAPRRRGERLMKEGRTQPPV